MDRRAILAGAGVQTAVPLAAYGSSVPNAVVLFSGAIGGVVAGVTCRYRYHEYRHGGIAAFLGVLLILLGDSLEAWFASAGGSNEEFVSFLMASISFRLWILIYLLPLGMGLGAASAYVVAHVRHEW